MLNLICRLVPAFLTFLVLLLFGWAILPALLIVAGAWFALQLLAVALAAVWLLPALRIGRPSHD